MDFVVKVGSWMGHIVVASVVVVVVVVNVVVVIAMSKRIKGIHEFDSWMRGVVL